MKTGFEVVSTVWDQHLVNSSAITELIEESKKKDMNQRVNTFDLGKGPIVPIYDVPRMIKTLRNGLLNGRSYTFALPDERKERVTFWKPIEMAFDKDLEEIAERRTFPGHISKRHIKNKLVPKMKVKYAVQVLSQRVGMHLIKTTSELKDDALKKETEDTGEFLLLCDQIFDSLNGATQKKHDDVIKPLRSPLTKTSGHMNFWTKQNNTIKSITAKTADDKINNKIRCIKNLAFTIENVKVLWSRLQRIYALRDV